MEKEIFAQRLIRLRKKKGYTQQQLAEQLNVTNKAISRWETGEGYPDITLLKPLSEALGISCDTLLSDDQDYKDIEKKDIQRYLPYLIALGSFILYYLLNMIQVPFIVSFLLMCCGFAGSIYLMVHHTDKHHLLTLLKFICALLFIPLGSVLLFLYMFKKISEIMNMSMIAMIGMQVNRVEGLNEDFMSEFGSNPFLMINVIALILVIIVYFLLKAAMRKKYDLNYTQTKLVSLPPFSQEKEKRYGILAQIVTMVCMIAVLIITYFTYLDLKQIDVTGLRWSLDYSAYLEVTMPMLNKAKGFMYLILAAGGMTTLYGWMKAKQKHWYVFDAGLLGICFLYVLFTTIEEGIFVKAPIIVIGLMLLYLGGAWYHSCRKKQKEKTQSDVEHQSDIT